MRKYIAPVLVALLLASTSSCHRTVVVRAPPRRVRHAPVQVAFEVVGNALTLPSPVVFEPSSDKLSPVSEPVLEVVLDYMNHRPDITLLRIEGHTDTDGNAVSNETLSEKRAMAVSRWLTAAGIECRRLMPVGFGQTQPLAPNDSPDNKARNRRVAFVNAAVNGASIGGASADGGGHVAGDPCE
jgi:OmpA-OmpF porin, OOP family